MSHRVHALLRGLIAGMAVALVPPQPHAEGAEPDLTHCSFVQGDVLVVWHAGRGTTIAYRGVPLFTANPSELIVHRKWQDVYYRTENGEAKGTLTRTDDESVLTIADRSERFAWVKRIIVRRDSSLHIEYELELSDPETAEIQVLWGLGKPWFHESKYQLTVGGQQREGELKAPDTGRLDPWGGATEQVLTTEHGTLTIKSTQPLNLLCLPDRGSLWWSQRLMRGETYKHAIDLSVKPGPATETGVRLVDIQWSRLVRDGNATFALTLAKTEGGPDRVRTYVAASGKTEPAGETVESALSADPTEVRCTARAEGKGRLGFAAVVTDAVSGKELLRLSPLLVEASPMFRALPRLSLYTHEARAEIVVDVVDDVDLGGLSVRLAGEGIPELLRPVTERRTMVPLDLAGVADGAHALTCRLQRDGNDIAQTTVEFRKAPPKPNEVKIDNLSRTLIADGLPFIPFGYYTYYPLAEGVIDEEFNRGFNLFSPYHGGPHPGDDLAPVREYMDRCAAIGMKVNYHAMWVNQTAVTDEQLEALRTEVEAFRDHPALLSWYIADEPAEDRVQSLEKAYRLIKELDPHHPVTIVYCRGAEHGRKFAGAMDIVMADPYPIPNGPVTSVSNAADSFNGAFDFAKPLWIVPQCFGGGEGWRREPTAREQRAMTYLALIHGARGIQYFIRKPRASFPKSPIMWSECGALALETAELTPALCSAETAPKVSSSLAAVHTCALRDRGIVTILAANTENRPLAPKLQLDGIDFTGEAEVLFENRKVQVDAGAIEEPLDAFGTRAYAIPVGPMPDEDLEIAEGNLTFNPSWEDNPSVGTPAGCYANAAHGSSLFVDARVARHGRHSLRLTAAAEDQAPSLSAFPFAVKAGQEYRVSIWAKGKAEGVTLDLSLGGLHEETLALTTVWKEYSFTVKPEKDANRVSAGVGLASAGVAWVDLLQVMPVAQD